MTEKTNQEKFLNKWVVFFDDDSKEIFGKIINFSYTYGIEFFSMENHKRADGTLKEYYVWRLTAPKTKILSDEEAIIRILEN